MALLELRNRLDDLPRLERWVREFGEQHGMAERDMYAQLNVNSNWCAISKKRRGVRAAPSVMSFSAARFRPSRPNVERWRVSAYGCPPIVAVPITGPCTETG